VLWWEHKLCDRVMWRGAACRPAPRSSGIPACKAATPHHQFLCGMPARHMQQHAPKGAPGMHCAWLRLCDRACATHMCWCRRCLMQHHFRPCSLVESVCQDLLASIHHRCSPRLAPRPYPLLLLPRPTVCVAGPFVLVGARATCLAVKANVALLSRAVSAVHLDSSAQELTPRGCSSVVAVMRARCVLGRARSRVWVTP
jgi:hypothetical protein